MNSYLHNDSFPPTTRCLAVPGYCGSMAAARENKWNMARTARTIGISRATLYEKTRKHGITRA